MATIDLESLTLLGTIFTASVLAVKILWDLSSTTHRRKYNQLMKYGFTTGVFLGVVFSLNQTLALVGSAAASIFLLLFSLFYYLLGGKATKLKIVQTLWTPGETVKDVFFLFSLVTGVAGIASTTFSTLMAPLIPDLSSPLISLSFDGLSVLSSLMGTTIFTPPYHIIYSLVYIHASRRRKPLIEPLYIDDIDFPTIVKGTGYTPTEVRDAMEALAKQGFCTKQSPTPLGRVRFKINTYGIKYIQACWALNYLKLSTQRERLEKTILYVERRATNLKARDRRLAKKALKEAASLKLRVLELRETYGDILERSWFDEMVYRLDTLTQRVREFLSAQQARTVQLPQFG